MARLIVRIVDNSNLSDLSLNDLRTQIGDVVEVLEDGHVFSLGERTNGQYRIIDVPSQTQEQLIYLVVSRFDVNQQMVKRRNLGFDIVVLNAGAWRTRTTATKSQIDAITITKV